MGGCSVFFFNQSMPTNTTVTGAKGKPDLCPSFSSSKTETTARLRVLSRPRALGDKAVSEHFWENWRLKSFAWHCCCHRRPLLERCPSLLSLSLFLWRWAVFECELGGERAIPQWQRTAPPRERTFGAASRLGGSPVVSLTVVFISPCSLSRFHSTPPPPFVSLSLPCTHIIKKKKNFQGRYELVCERAPGLMPFNPSRSTRVTLATPGCSPVAEAAARGERGNDDESPSSSSQLPPRRSPRDEFLIFNVGDALHVAPLFQIDGHPWRCLVFDGREGNGTAFVPPSSSLSFLRGTTPVCHAWRPLPPALRGKEPDVIVGLAGGACVLLSLELELGEAARVSRGGGRNRGDGDGGGDGEVKNNNFHSCASPSCSSPVAAQVLWPPPPLVLGGAARSPEDSSDFVAVSVSPSLPSRVVAVAWAPGSRAVVVHACGLVAVHEPPWRLERADEEEEEETEEEEGEGRRRTASGNGAFFEAVRATVTTPSPSTSQGGDDGGTDINVDTSSPASSSFLTATGTTTAGSSPPGGVGNQQLRASSTSPGGGGGIGAAAAAGLSAAAAAHATTPPTPPTPPSRRMTQSDFENSEREERQRLFARPAVRTFSVVTDLDEEEGGDEREASGRRRRTTKSKKAKKKKSVVSRSSIIAAAALSPDGTLLATAGRDGVARVHSLATGRLVAGFSAYYGALHAVAWYGVFLGFSLVLSFSLFAAAISPLWPPPHSRFFALCSSLFPKKKKEERG